MLVVGQKLWYVPSQRGTASEVTVTKIGRKWATVGEGYQAERIDLQTLRADGGQYSSPGTCYLSREVYEVEVELNMEWVEFYRRISHLPPAGVTQEDLKEARRLLRL